MEFLINGRGSRLPVPVLILIAVFLMGLILPGGKIHAQTDDGGTVAETEARDLSVEGLLAVFGNLENALPPMELDSNGDGRKDYSVRTDLDSGEKMMEVLDFNHDGKMDDFYFYDAGILRERAIDSNFDGLVDIWVYIEGGVYIAYYEKDTDFDGKMDKLRRYKENNQDG